MNISDFKVKFWPKTRTQNSANTKPLNLELLRQLTCFIFLSWLEKCFEEIFQKFKCEGHWAKLRQKFVCSDNPGQNIWHKVKRYNKIGQDCENIISNFACFWQLFSTFNFWKRDWELDCVYIHIWHFSNFSNFLRF